MTLGWKSTLAALRIRLCENAAESPSPSAGGGGGGGGNSEWACLAAFSCRVPTLGAGAVVLFSTTAPLGFAAAVRAAVAVSVALGRRPSNIECFVSVSPLALGTVVFLFVSPSPPVAPFVDDDDAPAAAPTAADFAPRRGADRLHASASASITGFNDSISANASSVLVFSRFTRSAYFASSQSPCSAIVSNTTDAYAYNSLYSCGKFPSLL